MKLQLTKTKTIDINLPFGSGGGAKSKSSVDLTGCELGGDDERGAPAVRISLRKGKWRLEAADFVKAPEGEMPGRWEDVAKQPTWELPRAFQSPHAAIAINSPLASFGQASEEAIVQEMMHGLATEPEKPARAADTPGKKKFSLHKGDEAKAPAPAPKPAAPTANAKPPELPKPGVPVSENGRRFAVRPFAEDGFHLSASLPEFQALWLSRLLPEGRRPTASSIQLADAALMASILAQPEFAESSGDTLAIFVRRNSIHFAGYRKGEPVLWRKCPSVKGSLQMRTMVRKSLGITEDLVDSVLEDSLIDPREALEPFLQPVLHELELSRAYLAGKHNIKLEKIFLMGLTAGAEHWRRYAEEALRLQIVAPDPFAGFELAKGLEAKDAQAFLVALGAAIAASETEVLQK